ncbi:hypothetical protein cyc_08979 [Cyclospora cayetanensis]|uniref:Uncharacterized protein n=1 Tax=Cyclospora cayetanensis TaxID=88456 RepID=A0A1D3D5S6_9EIME|nr:hypothetical protein cyc_08979 [Cyclospora cayetanensis]
MGWLRCRCLRASGRSNERRGPLPQPRFPLCRAPTVDRRVAKGALGALQPHLHADAEKEKRQMHRGESGWRAYSVEPREEEAVCGSSTQSSAPRRAETEYSHYCAQGTAKELCQMRLPGRKGQQPRTQQQGGARSNRRFPGRRLAAVGNDAIAPRLAGGAEKRLPFSRKESAACPLSARAPGAAGEGPPPRAATWYVVFSEAVAAPRRVRHPKDGNAAAVRGSERAPSSCRISRSRVGWVGRRCVSGVLVNSRA